MIARPMYSNPPIYGARIVSHILSNDALRNQWIGDCKAMADRLVEEETIYLKQI
jgi:aspartate aminotransferase